MHIPKHVPLRPGHPLLAVLIPTDIALDRRFLIVDARRVTDSTATDMWLQESPQVLNPVITLALIRRARPDLHEMGAFYLDCTPIRGYTELTTRVTLLTLMPSSFQLCDLPAVLQNSCMLRRRLGFLQHSARYRSRSSVAAYSTTSTTTCTTAVTAQERRARAQNIEGKPIRFYICSPAGHVESATLHGDLAMEDVMAQLCIQLADAHALQASLYLRACERVVSDAYSAYSVFYFRVAS